MKINTEVKTTGVIAIAIIILSYIGNVSLSPEYQTFWILSSLILVTYTALRLFNENLSKNDKYIGIAGVVIILISFTINSEMINDKDMFSSLKPEKVELTKLKFEQPRAMTKKMAAKIAGNVIGGKINGIQISSQYQLDIDSAVFQKVNNKQVIAIPLDYSGFMKWINQDSTPGYVIVSGTNPTEKPIFVKKEMKISKNGYMFDSIDRVNFIKSGFKRVDTHFEIDDNGVPYYIGLILEPTKFNTIISTTKVIVTNAETKESEILSIKDTLKKYPWIDSLKSEDRVLEKIEWFGEYEKGFWSKIFSGENINTPTDYNHRELWKVMYNGEMWYFTGMSSVNRNDNSLVEGILVNARNNKSLVFDMSGITDESQATGRLLSALGANAKTWSAILPQPLVINDNYYWGAVIVSDHGYFMKVGIVNPKNGLTIFAHSYEEAIKKIDLTNEEENFSNLSEEETITISKKKYLEIKRRIAELNSLVESL